MTGQHARTIPGWTIDHMSRITVAVAVLATLMLAAFAFSFKPIQEAVLNPVNPTEAKTSLAACAHVPQGAKPRCLEDAVLTAYAATGDLPALIGYLDQQIRSNPGLTGVTCHGTLHNVGSRMFTAEGNAALEKGTAGCTGGYYHGVLDAGGDVDKAMRVCLSFAVDEEKGDCAHGAGHAVWLATKSLAAGVRACTGEKYDPCIQGTFMEIAQAEQSSPSSLRHCADPALDRVTRVSCYRGLVATIVLEHPEEAASWCTQNATDEPSGYEECWESMGVGLGTAANTANPADDTAIDAFVANYCSKHFDCLRAAAENLLRQYGRITAHDLLCARVLTGEPASNRERRCESRT